MTRTRGADGGGRVELAVVFGVGVGVKRLTYHFPAHYYSHDCYCYDCFVEHFETVIVVFVPRSCYAPPVP